MVRNTDKLDIYFSRMNNITGLDRLNCECCMNYELDGGDEYGEGCFPICHKYKRMGNLKSFPFKKNMKCCFPDIWKTKYADKIYKQEYEDGGYVFSSHYHEQISLVEKYNKDTEE